MRIEVLSAWTVFFALSGVASGNTEIVNFPALESGSVDLPFTNSWPVLNRELSSLQINVTSAKLGSEMFQTVCSDIDKWSPGQLDRCPHELWVVLDLDEPAWKKFEKFTLRLSWAAFNPTEIKMKIYDPSSLSASPKPTSTPSHSSTRRKYARIQMIHAGILTPTVNNSLDDSSRYQVPIILKLEPLYFGVLPSSVIPTVFAILAAIVIGLHMSGKINDYFQTIIRAAKVQDKTQ